MTSLQDHHLVQPSQRAYLGTRLMGTPFWCLLSMLAFILYKNIHLTPFQIAVIVALKPATSLLSPYWSQAIYGRPDKITANLVGANFFRYLPFLFVPWIESAWLIIGAFGLYMMLSRATIPTWMELFKYTLPKEKREQTVGYGAMIDYLGAAILAVGIGVLLDLYPEMWRWIFFCGAALGVLSTPLLFGLSPAQTPLVPTTPHKIKDKLSKPWKQVWDLVTHHREFTLYQIGFMLGGGGLMIMQPALPQFFVDTLNLSFIEMGLAISLCKGIGVACTTPIWTRYFRRVNIFRFSALVTLFATLFPFLLMASAWHVILIYLAYALYGIMQAGSELSWHMSGLVFAEEKESATFSSTNVLTVGIRGCLIPALGALLLPTLHPVGTMILGALLCLTASAFFFLHRRAPRTAHAGGRG